MKQFIAIDLKSFYASVECRERGLDPLLTNLVVADATRTEKTICLAVTPSLKAYGISGRARLFEVVSRVKEINADRRRLALNHHFTGKSENARALSQDARWLQTTASQGKVKMLAPYRKTQVLNSITSSRPLVWPTTCAIAERFLAPI